MAEKSWKQADLARATGISPQQINNYVKARTPPGLDTIEKIAEALGKPIADFFKEEITMSGKINQVPAEIIEFFNSNPSQMQIDIVMASAGIAPKKPVQRQSAKAGVKGKKKA